MEVRVEFGFQPRQFAHLQTLLAARCNRSGEANRFRVIFRVDRR